jgi:hypothetical protein
MACSRVNIKFIVTSLFYNYVFVYLTYARKLGLICVLIPSTIIYESG